jgi:AcrR family transcriptional regulator
MSTPSDKTDGRRARTTRGKAVAIQALLEIIDEGRPFMTVADVVERSGISERTLFRYFGTVDKFLSEAAGAAYPRMEKYFDMTPPKGSLESRIEALIALRLSYIASIGGLARAVDAHSPQSEMANVIRIVRDTMFADQVTAWLGDTAQKLPADSLIVLQSLLSFGSIDRLREQLGKRTTGVLARSALEIIHAEIRRART